MKYRKKPVEIEAIQWTGSNEEELAAWAGDCATFTNYTYKKAFMDYTPGNDRLIIINTLEGKMIGHIGDWIIKGVHGEFYPCHKEIFDETYELAPCL